MGTLGVRVQDPCLGACTPYLRHRASMYVSMFFGEPCLGMALTPDLDDLGYSSARNLCSLQNCLQHGMVLVPFRCRTVQPVLPGIYKHFAAGLCPAAVLLMPALQYLQAFRCSRVVGNSAVASTRQSAACPIYRLADNACLASLGILDSF